MRFFRTAASGAAVAILSLSACLATAPPAVDPVMPAALTPVDGDHNKSREFSRVFCSALSHFKDPDNHAWGDCSKYIEIAEPPAALPAFTTTYRFLLVGGFGGDCLKDVHAFAPAIEHLKSAHQITVEAFAVAPYASSEENGKSIAKHIDEGIAGDKTHRYVLLGYDKGAADLIEALRVLDAAPSKVAAVVTIAGMVGGVWLPESVRTLVEPPHPWIDPSCPGNVKDGMASITREVRQSVLRGSPLQVPGYSLVASSALADTSEALRPMWKRLSVYTKEQDGELVAWESILPGARFLGTARADHWAVALPFGEAPARTKSKRAKQADQLSSTPAYKAIDRNRFPREALFEAVVRFVNGDIPPAEPAGR